MLERSERSVPELLERGTLLLVLLVALATRAAGLREWWLNPDEGIYYSVVTRASAAGFWAEVAANAHPPLYYLLLRLLGLFTWDFYWFRVLSLIACLVAVYAFWMVGKELGGTVAAVTAALLLALSPAAVELSQVMRPYTLQLAFLGGSSWCLLRLLREPTPRLVAGYLTLLCLALLTHYSSVLALGVYALVILGDGLSKGFARRDWQRLLLLHALPVLLVGCLWLFHVRPFMATSLAQDSLGGWLSFYMLRSPADAWLALVGFASLVTDPRVSGPTLLLLLTALAASAAGNDRRPILLAGGGLFIGLGAALAGAYPMGATRHATWLLVFTIPVLGWLATHLFARPGKGRVLCISLTLLLLAAGDPLGRWIGRDRAPWSPDDRILRWDDLVTMVDVIDPEGRPELVLMSGETFYLLLPFFPREREQAAFTADSALFRFQLGERKVVVSEAWAFSAGSGAPDAADLGKVLNTAAGIFADVDLARDSVALLLVGGWRAPLVRQLTEQSRRNGFLLERREIPGLAALLLDVESYRRASEGEPSPLPPTEGTPLTDEADHAQSRSSQSSRAGPDAISPAGAAGLSVKPPSTGSAEADRG